MSLSFAAPLAFWGFLGLPALLAIYFFRARFRDQPVSTLMFWLEETPPMAGGQRREKLRLPLLFFIEAMIIILLVLAAASPRLPGTQPLRPYVVILDDSWSMSAGGANSPRSRGLAALKAEWSGWPFSTIRFILAGPQPVVLGDPIRSIAQAGDLLKEWRGQSPGANLAEALALADDLAGERARLVVVSDQSPSQVPEDGRLRWLAFGKSAANLAFTQALRSRTEDGDKILLEITNLASEPQITDLVVDSDGRTEKTPLELAPNASRRVRFELSNLSASFSAAIGNDGLGLDNRIELPGRPPEPLPVRVGIRETRLRLAVERALLSTGMARLGASEPVLIFTDDLSASASAAVSAVPGKYGDIPWMVRFIRAGEPQPLLGPFLIDHSHPLSEGVALAGTVWAVGSGTDLPGNPVITAGSIPLLSARPTRFGQDLFWRLLSEYSTLPTSPDWPILFYNLLLWRMAELPGPERVHVPLGGELRVTLPSASTKGVLHDPNGVVSDLTAPDRHLAWKPEFPGLHRLEIGPRSFFVAVNPLNRAESDLRAAESGSWGIWKQDEGPRESIGVAWMFLLPALLLLAFHAALQAAGTPRSGGNGEVQP